MHAYLLVGNHEEGIGNKAEEVAKKLKAKILEFPLSKIDDVRKLNSFTSLKVTEPTAIYINSIEEATPEALNAFLKNLEEPQENLYYILTATSTRKVLPTIVSRCQTVRIRNQEYFVGSAGGIRNDNAEKFLKMTVGERLTFLDGIKEREKAIEFIEEFIFYCHQPLYTIHHNHSLVSNNLSLALATLKALKANGNVVLQLTNFVVNLGN